MTTLEVINRLYEAGLTITLQPSGSINLKPTKLVTPSLVNLVKVRKKDLIKYFTEKDDLKQLPKLVGSQATYDSDPLLEELIELGNQICNYWGDSEDARDQMRSDILSYPPHQREALMGTLKGSLKDDRPR